MFGLGRLWGVPVWTGDFQSIQSSIISYFIAPKALFRILRSHPEYGFLDVRVTHGESRVLVETRLEMVTNGVGISYLEGLMTSMIPFSHSRGVRVLPREVD